MPAVIRHDEGVSPDQLVRFLPFPQPSGTFLELRVVFSFRFAISLLESK